MGGRIRDRAAGRRAGTAVDLYDEVAVPGARSSTMIWRKKLYDDLSVRIQGK